MRAAILTTEKSYAKVGKVAKVKCVAVGMPRPKFSWKWRDHGKYEQKLSADEGQVGRFLVENHNYFGNSTSYLVIKDVRPDDLREYECRLKDGVILDKKTIPLVGYCKYFLQSENVGGLSLCVANLALLKLFCSICAI